MKLNKVVFSLTNWSTLHPLIFFTITIRQNFILNSFLYSKAKGIQEKQGIQKDHEPEETQNEVVQLEEVQLEEVQEEVVQPEEIQEEQVVIQLLYSYHTVVIQLLYSC